MEDTRVSGSGDAVQLWSGNTALSQDGLEGTALPAHVVVCGLLASWGPLEVSPDEWVALLGADLVRSAPVWGVDSPPYVPRHDSPRTLSANASELDTLRRSAGWITLARRMVDLGLSSELVEEDLAPVLSDLDRMQWSYRHRFLLELQPAVRNAVDELLRPVVHRYFASMIAISPDPDSLEAGCDYYFSKP